MSLPQLTHSIQNLIEKKPETTSGMRLPILKVKTVEHQQYIMVQTVIYKQGTLMQGIHYSDRGGAEKPDKRGYPEIRKSRHGYCPEPKEVKAGGSITRIQEPPSLGRGGSLECVIQWELETQRRDSCCQNSDLSTQGGEEIGPAFSFPACQCSCWPNLSRNQMAQSSLKCNLQGSVP